MSDLCSELELLSVEQAARRLLGSRLIRQFDDGQVAEVMIVETEAYDEDDPASHTYTGLTERNAAMFGPPGHAYVYRSYGIHWCFNVTVGQSGYGAGALIRAVEPLSGLEPIRKRRPGVSDVNMTNGPGKLTQALAIDASFNNHDLSIEPLQVLLKPPVIDANIVATTRIGLTKAADKQRRFYLKNSIFVSKLMTIKSL